MCVKEYQKNTINEVIGGEKLRNNYKNVKIM